MEQIDRYAEIIDLPHPDPKRHRRMPMSKRAGQFMPFAALTGMVEMFEYTRIVAEERLSK